MITPSQKETIFLVFQRIIQNSFLDLGNMSLESMDKLCGLLMMDSENLNSLENLPI
jgi:hypothetical protein